MKRNPKETKRQRRYLRNHMTKWEVRLWSDLKGRKMFGFKVRRQHGFDKYIVDFYCPELQLAIEVDGDVHYLKGRTERDYVKDLFLKDEGIQMIRIKTGDLGVIMRACLATWKNYF